MDNQNLHKEIQEERKQLKEELEQKEKKAQEEIDRILAEKEFCSRCNSKVFDRTEFAGKCSHKECEKMVCESCWSAEEKRYCLDHSEIPLGKEKDEKEKTFFKPEEPALEKSSDILTNQDDTIIENLTKNYTEFLKQRLSAWTPDWTPKGWIENAKPNLSSKKDFLEITVSSGNFIFKKPRLKILVMPFHGKNAEDLDFLLSKIKNEENLYYILVLIANEVDVSALEFVDSFNRQNASLFLIEPTKHLIYMDEKPITPLFSFWVDSKKAPDNLKTLLSSLVKEKVMGREMITSKSVSEKFKFAEDQALVFLKSCKFLKHLEDTDTFYFQS